MGGKASAQMTSSAQTKFDLLDSSKDGFLTLAEVEGKSKRVELCAESEEDLRKKLVQMDANQDGKISREEAGILKQHP